MTKRTRASKYERPNSIITNPLKRSKATKINLEDATWQEDVMDCKTFERRPITQGFIKRFAAGMVQWIDENPDELFIATYGRNHGINKDVLCKWKDKYPEINEAYKYTMEKIIERRESGAITKKYDGNFVSRTMPMYSKEWRDMLEWQAKLKADNPEHSGTKIVIMDRFSDGKENEQ